MILSWTLLLVWLVAALNAAMSWLSIRRVASLPSAGAAKAPLPRVSLCVPARNEAPTLRRTMPRFLAQEYPDFELIVVNDNSEDETGAVLAGFADDPRLTVIHGTAPKPGVVGKCNALAQAAQRASGEYLCFADADIEYEPRALAAAMRIVQASGADMVALSPRMVMKSFAERLILPQLPFTMCCGLPIFWINRDRFRWMGFGTGACNVISREAYDRIGGHAAMPHAVIDDIELGRRVARAGLRLRVAEGRNLVAVRIYSGFRQIVDGFSKNLGAPAGGSLLIAAGMSILFFLFEVLPFLLLPAIPWMAPAAAWPLAGAVALNLSVTLGLVVVAQAGWPFLLLRPVSPLIWLWMFWRSALMHRRGAASWRGRSLTPSAPPSHNNAKPPEG